MNRGWSNWDSTGNRRVRSFADAEGVVRFYQWDNENGHYTPNRVVNSGRVSNAVVRSILLEFENITPRSSLNTTADPASLFNELTLDAASSAHSEAENFKLQSQSAAPTSDFILPEEDDGQKEAPLSKDVIDAGLKQHVKPVRWHFDKANLIDLNSQGSVRKFSQLPEGYCVRHRKFYQRGRVFSTVFPTSGGQSGISGSRLPNVNVYITLRPVVVIHSYHGHCLCIPIFSYEGTGLTKKAFSPQQRRDHAVIHMRNTTAVSHQSEGMTHGPFQVYPAPGQTLTAMSRIRFDMWHVVQYNELTKNLGSVDRAQIARLLNCVTEATPLWNATDEQSSEAI